MARLSTSTARNATLGIAAAAMLAATSLASPARADQSGKGSAPKIDGLPAQCLKAGNELAQLKCGRSVFQKQISDANARSADAKARGAEADKEGVCLGLIMKDLESNGTKTASLTEPPSKGQACNLARSLKLVAG